MDSSKTLLLDRAIYYRLHGSQYPPETPPLTDNEKKSVRRKAKTIVVYSTGEVFIQRKRKLVEVVRSPQEKERIFSEYHQASDHSGWHKTWEQIAEKYYWRDCSGDVKKWVKECADCQQRRNRTSTCERPSSNFGLSEQGFHGSSGECVQGQTQQFTPYQTLTGVTDYFDSADDEATEQVLPAEEESEGSIGPEHWTENGSHYAQPNTDRPAPFKTSISSGANFSLASSLEVMQVTSVSGHSSMLLQMASFPCGSDQHHQQLMTPLADSGACCIKQEMPDDPCYFRALDYVIKDLSDPEEESIPVYSHPSTSLIKARIARPIVSRFWDGQMIVEYKMPSPYQTMEEYIQKSSLEEDGGYYGMESVMRVVRKLEHLHSQLLGGHGALSDPSSIVLCVAGTSGHEHLVTLIIPKLGKLAEAVRQEAVVPYSPLTFGLGMVDDIASLGGTLRELLALLQDRRIHVSKRLLGCFESATDHCQRALDIATIAEDLPVKKSCLCTLHVEFQLRRIRNILCLEGENIYEVLSTAWLDGRTVESCGCRLIFNDSTPVMKDSEVIYPVCTVQLVPCR